MYTYACNNCHKHFESLNLAIRCIYCGSAAIYIEPNSSPIGNDTPTGPTGPTASTGPIGSTASTGSSTTGATAPPVSPTMYNYVCNNCFFSFTSLTPIHTCKNCSSTHIVLDTASYNSSPIPSSEPAKTTPSGPTGATGGATSNTADPANGSTAFTSATTANLYGWGGTVTSVDAFFEQFHSTEADEAAYLQTLIDSSEGNLQNSTYGGQYGVFDDGSKASDAGITAMIQGMDDTEGTITDDVYVDAGVFGMPLYYNAYADPCKSVFNDTLSADMPLVAIVPGKPKVNRKLIDASGSKIVNLDEYYKKTDGDTETSGSTGILSPKNEEDMRYLSFEVNYTEYWKYLQFLTSEVHNWLVARDSESTNIEMYRISTELKNKYTGKSGLCFYADRSTSVSETASNSYGTSRIQEMVNEKSGTTREASMLGSYGGFTEFVSGMAQNIGNLVEGVTTGLDSLKSFEGILTKSANSFMKVVNGAQLDFPEMWQDSRFDRSYSASFRFYSPYGDRASIEKFVYTPFLALLAFVLPRQDQAFSYVEPFLVRVDAPGFFSVDCGVITSMSINKGGTDNLWTIDGLPRLMEVTIDIQDLYPMIKQLSKISMKKYNRGLCNYLENMAGVRAEDLNLSAAFGLSINRLLANSILTTWDAKLGNILEQWGYGIDTWASKKIANLLT